MSSKVSDLPDLSGILTSQKEFSEIVKTCIESKDTDAPRLDLLSVRFLESDPDIHGLAEVVCSQVINYVIPKKKIRQVLEKVSADPSDFSIFSRLDAEAKRAFLRFNTNKDGVTPQSRYSEIGEVVAFCVASHFLNAGQVAAKMALKTSSEMPVHGVDGIHARMESDGTMTVFFLESKMVYDGESGCEQYADSVCSFESDRRTNLNELRIARDLSNLDILEESAKEQAMDYFDPYSKNRSNVRERFVGVLIHSEKSYERKIDVNDATPLDAHHKNFVALYSAKSGVFSKKLGSKIKAKGGDPGKCRAFMIPVPNSDKLNEIFSNNMSNDHLR